jgi:hypothetical protein
MLRRLRKINVTPIVSDHVKTLKDHRTGKLLYSDLVLFFFLPIVLGVIATWNNVQLRAIAVTGLLTASALFVGLLLNLLVMVLAYLRTTHGDPAEQHLQLRKALLREVTVNLSFSILVALTLVATALAALFGLGDNNQDLKIGCVATFLLVTGASTLVLSLLMILRRMYFLIINEFDLHTLREKDGDLQSTHK